MPSLKTERGTVLYARVYGQTSPTISVFDRMIGGIRADGFLMEDGTFCNLAQIDPNLGAVPLASCELFISYPDGSAKDVNQINFNPVLLVTWSATVLNQFAPTVDPNWINNPSYVTINGAAVSWTKDALKKVGNS